MLPPMCPRPTKPIFVAVVVAISCPPFDHRDVVLAASVTAGSRSRRRAGGSRCYESTKGWVIARTVPSDRIRGQRASD